MKNIRNIREAEVRTSTRSVWSGDKIRYNVIIRESEAFSSWNQEEAENAKNEINEIERGLTPLTAIELDSIKEIEQKKVRMSEYIYQIGDFITVFGISKIFHTPMGRVEVKGGNLWAEWTKGRGVPFYEGKEKYNEVNNPASTIIMSGDSDYVIFGKPNTYLTVSEGYINSNESLIFNRCFQLSKTITE